MNNPKLETYLISQTWKRILARVLDIIFSSALPLILTGIWYLVNKTQSQKWWVLLTVIIFNFILMIFYFIIIPWKFNGQTLGKKICFIKLVNEKNNNLSLKSIIYRELFLVIIPMFLTITIIFTTNVVLGSNIAKVDLNTTEGYWINIFIRIVFSFIFAWYLGIMIVTKIDKKHQIFYDRKYQLYVVNIKPVKNKNHNSTKQETKIHVHLGDNQPGNLTDDELNKIQKL